MALALAGCGISGHHNPHRPTGPRISTSAADAPGSSFSPPLVPPHLTSVDFLNPTVGWAAGYWGWGKAGSQPSATLRTTDGGRSWQEAQLPGDFLLGLHFIDPSRGWAVAETNLANWDYQDIAILATRDGGRSWQVQWKSPKSAILNNLGFLQKVRLFFFGPRHGVVLIGGLLLTTAGDSGWRPDLESAVGTT